MVNNVPEKKRNAHNNELMLSAELSQQIQSLEE